MVSVKISKISNFIQGTATMKELIITFSPQKGSQKLRKQAVSYRWLSKSHNKLPEEGFNKDFQN
jgi:hypothetical protein